LSLSIAMGAGGDSSAGRFYKHMFLLVALNVFFSSFSPSVLASSLLFLARSLATLMSSQSA